MLSVTDATMTDNTKINSTSMKKTCNFILIPALALAVLAGFGCASHDGAGCCQKGATACSKPAATPPAAVAAPAAPVKIALKVVKVDSEETAGENGAGANAVDGDTNTIWHTQWQDATPECPHEIVIELTPAATIKGLTYLPRQDDSENGTIKGYELYVSNDGNNFGQPVAKGEFENSKDLKTVTFAPQACRFIKLKALSEANDGAWTSAAEIGVVQ
jgi:phospholipase C